MLYKLIKLGEISTEVYDGRFTSYASTDKPTPIIQGRIITGNWLARYKYKAIIVTNLVTLEVYFLSTDPDLLNKSTISLHQHNIFIVYQKYITNLISRVFLCSYECNQIKLFDTDQYHTISINELAWLIDSSNQIYSNIINTSGLMDYTPLSGGLLHYYITCYVNEIKKNDNDIDFLINELYEDLASMFDYPSPVDILGGIDVDSPLDKLLSMVYVAKHRIDVSKNDIIGSNNLRTPTDDFRVMFNESLEYLINDSQSNIILDDKVINYNVSNITHFNNIKSVLKHTYDDVENIEIWKTEQEIIHFNTYTNNSVFHDTIDIFTYVLTCNSLINSAILDSHI